MAVAMLEHPTLFYFIFFCIYLSSFKNNVGIIAVLRILIEAETAVPLSSDNQTHLFFMTCHCTILLVFKIVSPSSLEFVTLATKGLFYHFLKQ